MDVNYRIIAFVNKGSGGNHGQRVLQALKNHIGDENVFDIMEDKGPEKGLTARASDPTMDVRCLVAGGDGTFSWVANVIEKTQLSHVSLCLIPLGSGNDMSRAMGWGRKFPGLSAILQHLDYLPDAHTHRLDTWRLTTVHNPVPSASPDKVVDDHDIVHGARPLVCNYLSLGADAFVELRFNQLRWANPHKYKSRLGNFQAHGIVGMKYMCGLSSQKIHIIDHIQELLVDDKPIHIADNLQALIFLNIPSYGAGTQPWGFMKSKQQANAESVEIVDKMYVDDQQFEVIGLRDLTHFGLIKLFRAHGVRIAQGKRMSLTLKSESTPFQVDGEPWEQRGGTVTLEPGNDVGIVEGPIWTDKSRKNAKFANIHAKEDLVPVENPVKKGHTVELTDASVS